MSDIDRIPPSVAAVEAIMLEKFKTEPFHNLHLLYGNRLELNFPGGTCSDKTLSFLSAVKQAGFNAALHSGFIGGREIHRLARVQIDGRLFFADVGNGWPSLRLYPADQEIRFRCFGMSYRTEVTDRGVRVFHERRGTESLQLEIDVRCRPENEIRNDIAGRFNSGVVYPFSNSLRFSLVVGSQFLFLRCDRLEIHSEDDFQAVEGIREADLPEIIRRYFGLDQQPFLSI